MAPGVRGGDSGRSGWGCWGRRVIESPWMNVHVSRGWGGDSLPVSMGKGLLVDRRVPKEGGVVPARCSDALDLCPSSFYS